MNWKLGDTVLDKEHNVTGTIVGLHKTYAWMPT